MPEDNAGHVCDDPKHNRVLDSFVVICHTCFGPGGRGVYPSIQQAREAKIYHEKTGRWPARR